MKSLKYYSNKFDVKIMIVRLFFLALLFSFNIAKCEDFSYSEEQETGTFQVIPEENYLPNLPPENSVDIPKIVWQTWEVRKVPMTIFRNIQKMKKMNPDYQFILVDDKERKDFMRKYFEGPVADAYFSINPKLGAAKADLWRYCVLYIYGGVYLDLDSSTLVPLHTWIEPDDTMVVSYGESFSTVSEWILGRNLSSEVPRGWEERKIQNGVIISQPGHPFLLEVINIVTNNIHSWKDTEHNLNIPTGLKVLTLTGPIAWTEAIYNIIKNDANVSYRIEEKEEQKIIPKFPGQEEKNKQFRRFASYKNTPFKS